jgi:hypothetical protein
MAPTRTKDYFVGRLMLATGVLCILKLLQFSAVLNQINLSSPKLASLLSLPHQSQPSQSNRVPTLQCTDKHGSLSSEIAQEMIYWKDSMSDSEIFFASEREVLGQRRYLVCEIVLPS